MVLDPELIPREHPELKNGMEALCPCDFPIASHLNTHLPLHKEDLLSVLC
jgi:hypothetical protein